METFGPALTGQILALRGALVRDATGLVNRVELDLIVARRTDEMLRGDSSSTSGV